MFYFLIITGCILIILGIYMDKPTNKEEEAIATPYREVEELYLLNERLEYLENILLQEEASFQDIGYEIEGEIEKEEIQDDLSLKEESLSYGLEKYRLLLKYEAENHSLEEICTLLNMDKGEVLLLKNLYKNYSN